MVIRTGYVDEIPELVKLRLASLNEDHDETGEAYGEFRGYLLAVSRMQDVPILKLENIINQIADLSIIER